MVINYEVRDVSEYFVGQAYYRPAYSNDWIVQEEDAVEPVDPDLGPLHLKVKDGFEVILDRNRQHEAKLSLTHFNF